MLRRPFEFSRAGEVLCLPNFMTADTALRRNRRKGFYPCACCVYSVADDGCNESLWHHWRGVTNAIAVHLFHKQSAYPQWAIFHHPN